MADAPLDEKVKRGLLVDALKMLNLNSKRKAKYINAMKYDMHRRLTGQSRMSFDERELLRAKKLRIRDKFELNN